MENTVRILSIDGGASGASFWPACSKNFLGIDRRRPTSVMKKMKTSVLEICTCSARGGACGMRPHPAEMVQLSGLTACDRRLGPASGLTCPSHANRCPPVVAIEHAGRPKDLGNDQNRIAAKLGPRSFGRSLGFDQR
jgi:hypothetical protein